MAQHYEPNCIYEDAGSKTWLPSLMAVAVVWAGSCSSDSTPSLGTSTCCGPKKRKNKTKQNKTEKAKKPHQGLSLLFS